VHRLTALKVKNAKPGDKLSDGGGLRLDVDRNGNRNWIFRFTSPVTRKERFMGLGPVDDVSLSDARDAAQDARNLLRQGIDPIEHRNTQRAAAKVEASRSITFNAYAEQFISSREAGWKNDKHRQQWRNSLRDYAYPHIGNMSVADVDTAAVMKVLRPVWMSKPETGTRLRGRVEVILSAAKAEGLRTGENPALWRGHIDQLLPSKKKVRTVKHHAALPYSEMPAFMASLRTDRSVTSKLLRFIIVTAARYGEAAWAEGHEIDRKRRLWTVPAARMKGGRPHVVPLSDAALDVLGEPGDGLLFASEMTGRPLSDVALANVIKRHTETRATTHGFRSTFRDWAGDMTTFPREVAEMALAHVIDDETEAAYRRGTALEKRRKLMDAWAAYCAKSTSGKVVAFSGADQGREARKAMQK
jgi:integrase